MYLIVQLLKYELIFCNVCYKSMSKINMIYRFKTTQLTG